MEIFFFQGNSSTSCNATYLCSELSMIHLAVTQIDSEFVTANFAVSFKVHLSVGFSLKISYFTTDVWFLSLTKCFLKKEGQN